MKFRIGDRVRLTIIAASYEGLIIGKSYGMLAIEFDSPVPGGHTCDGACAVERGLWFSGSSPPLVPLWDTTPTKVNNFGDFVRAQNKRSQTEVSEKEERVRQRIACDELGYPACEALYLSTAEWEQAHDGRSWSEHVAEAHT